jgi:hypothetical protein
MLTSCSGSSTPSPAPTVTVTTTATVTAAPAASTAAAQGLLQPESCQRVSTGADGNPSPVVCRDGHPNAYAMPVLEGTAPHLFALGEFATTDDIYKAECADLPHSTNPIESSAYDFMKALNGWSFGIDPTDGGLFSACR